MYSKKILTLKKTCSRCGRNIWGAVGSLGGGFAVFFIIHSIGWLETEKEKEGGREERHRFTAKLINWKQRGRDIEREKKKQRKTTSEGDLHN